MKLFDFENKPFLSLIIAGVLFVSFVTIMNVVTLFFTPINSATVIVKKALDPDALVYNYEWFKRQNEDVKAFSTKIKNTDDSLKLFETSLKDLPKKDWSFENNQRWNDLQSQLLGLKNQCEDMVKTYNAQSKMANRNFVKFGDLPDQLESSACVATN